MDETVSPEEALNALKNLDRLSRISKHNGSTTSSRGMGEWIYKCNANDSDHISPSPSSPKASLIPSLTSNAMQRNWKTPTEFLLCPDSCGENGLEAYYSRLATDVKFCSNKYGDSVVSDYAYLPTGDAFLVMCKSTEENPVKLGLCFLSLVKMAFTSTKALACSFRRMVQEGNDPQAWERMEGGKYDR